MIKNTSEIHWSAIIHPANIARLWINQSKRYILYDILWKNRQWRLIKHVLCFLIWQFTYYNSWLHLRNKIYYFYVDHLIWIGSVCWIIVTFQIESKTLQQIIFPYTIYWLRVMLNDDDQISRLNILPQACLDIFMKNVLYTLATSFKKRPKNFFCENIK